MRDSDAFLADAMDHPRGVSGGGPGAAGAGLDAGGANLRMRFSITGTAPAGPAVNDQASFFEREDPVAIDTTFALATIATSTSRFNSAAVRRYITHNPARIRNVNIPTADSAGTVSSLVLRPVRYDPYGRNSEDQIQASDYQTAQDQQATRVQIPLSFAVDGYAHLRMTNTANATPASYTATFAMREGLDRRLEVPSASAAVVVSPGSISRG